MKHSYSLAMIAMAGAFATPAFAQLSCDKSYGFQATVDTTVGQSLCSSKVDTFLDGLHNFQTSNFNYTPTSAATANARFNDVDLKLAYQLNSTTLKFDVPQLSVTKSFIGAGATAATARQDAQNQLEDYLKKSNVIGQIMNYQAKNSATSPISGVGGLIPMSIAADFDSNFTGSATAVAAAAPQSTGANNLVGAAVNYGSYKVDQSSDRVSTVTIPISYTIRNDIDPRRQLSISLPITEVDIGGAKSYHGGLGVSYRLPMSDHWTLTPGGRASVVASRDRATVSTVYSGSLTSTYVIPLSSFDVSIGNMLGYYRTGKFSSGDYSFDPDIKNTVMRNGVMLSQPINLGTKLSIEYSLIDTRYLGEKPFLDNFQEFGITIGTNRSALSARSYLRAGLTYMRAESTNGFNANMGYWF